MLIQLVSFKLCPFVQRSIIMLLEKNISYNVTYIDLEHKPSWFLRMSPTGKVPVLRVGKNDVLFESAVINEYLDEVYPPSSHPTDPLQKAKNRAWIEFSSKLLFDLHKLITTKSSEEYQTIIETIKEAFKTLELNIMHKPYFNGKNFALIDAAFAPLFMRINYLNTLLPLNLYAPKSRVMTWEQNLLTRKSVKISVVPEFFTLYKNKITTSEGCLAEFIKKAKIQH